MSRREKLTIELKEDIGAAILELMQEKSFDKITVDELTKKADVGRVTFYRQFKSKQEAIAFKLERDWEKYGEEKNLNFETTPPQEFAEAFFEFFYSLKDINDLLIKNDLRSCILDAMRIAFKNIENTENKKEYYREHFLAYGLLGLVDGWIDAGYDLSIKKISKIALETFYKV